MYAIRSYYADLKKEGSQFDLGIALLIALNHTDCEMGEWYVFGELGLDGSVKENALLYALILSLVNTAGLRKAVVPKESLPKLANIPGIAFYGVAHLTDAVITSYSIHYTKLYEHSYTPRRAFVAAGSSSRVPPSAALVARPRRRIDQVEELHAGLLVAFEES